MNEERFLTEYENLLDKGYCNCNEMNCIDNNSPRRILNIAKRLQQENQQLKEQLKQKEDIINKVNDFINEYEKNRNCFKWNEEDYIDVINEIKQILNNKGDEK